ncbi:MAG TPA: BLUF domain-containing protein [Aquabacterium sp.]|uniref:BLUF domain-containing protein n=1 Tax=Aquabacterium sp. TaxID=1872578 RepID=UPI002E2F13F7|nr:BLUF domain-containing protein [Aquabacterium sp.]HEX5371490.1 BLUF domain-containing protein [Aquabacterium sp.]
MEALYCIVYVSSAWSRLEDQALETLLQDARRFNEQAHVTGVLLYSGGTFFQYMEGPLQGVTQAYARVRRSRAHHSIYELLNKPIDERAFSRWFMGLSHAPASTVLALQNAAWHSQVDALPPAPQASGNHGLLLLQAYWRDNAHAL